MANSRNRIDVHEPGPFGGDRTVAPALAARNDAPPAIKLIARDTGPFLKVAATYSYTKLAPRYGDVVLSPTAIYLVKGQQVSLNHAFGLAGALVQAAVDKREDDLRSCLLSEMPDAVREQFKPWRRFENIDVIVLPKACVHRIETMWTGGLRVCCGEERFQVNSRLFRAAKARRFLREHRWMLDEDVDVSAAPVHGESFGRTPTTPSSYVTERAKAAQQPTRKEQLVFVGIAVIVVTLLVVTKFHQAKRASAAPAAPAFSPPPGGYDPYRTVRASPAKSPRH